ncbi:unnamed protein product [Diamesa tonsa]
MSHSPTGGVSAFPIAGRMVKERERLNGMTNDERMWRKQWLKDQELTKNEPKYVSAYWKERVNPIRRFYTAPLDMVCKAMTPAIGFQKAYFVRFWIGKAALVAATVYAGAYYFKYNANDWTRKGGWRVIKSRTAVVPGDEGFPKASDRSQPSDYAARGFKTAAI